MFPRRSHIPVAECGDADLPQVLVAHVREDLDVDVLAVEDLPEGLELEAGQGN